MQVKEVPVPPGARRGELEGAYEIALRTAISQALRELKEKYGAAEVEIYHITPETDWNAVRDFYEARFGQMGLVRDTGFAEEHAGYRLGVWRREGLTAKAALAAALVETGRTSADATPQKFLAVFRAGD